MAYLDLDFPRFPLASPTAASPVHHGTVSRIGPLERRVVRLARADGRWSLRKAGPMSAMLNWMFGLERPNPLADPRLEALRRYAVMFRLHVEKLPHAEDDRMIGIGFSVSALDQVRRMVRGKRYVGA